MPEFPDILAPETLTLVEAVRDSVMLDFLENRASAIFAENKARTVAHLTRVILYAYEVGGRDPQALKQKAMISLKAALMTMW
jgi:hypothetical protein